MEGVLGCFREVHHANFAAEAQFVRVSLPRQFCSVRTFIRGSFPDSQWTKESQLTYSIAKNEFFAVKLMRKGEKFQLVQKEGVFLHPRFPSTHVICSQDPIYGQVNIYPGPSEHTLTTGSAFRGKSDSHYQDAICVSRDFLGLADGVSAWSQRRIDAGAFARELISHCQDSAQRLKPANCDSGSIIAAIAEESLHRTKAVGSATLSLVQLVGGKVHVLSIGDSQVAVVRESKVVMKTKTLMHNFSTPYQLARIPATLQARFHHDSVSDADVSSFDICVGDIIIVASDGVWDNLFDAEIIEVLKDKKGASEEEKAKAITQKAFEKSHSCEMTPFSMNYRGEEGWAYLGGKPDDITTIVAEVRVTREIGR